MPGHFTHIYTARRVADLLESGQFTDWPDLGAGGGSVSTYDAQTCGHYMRKWEKFTALGAIGPDIFFFSEDWSNDLVGPHSDKVMLALATYYYFDAASENEWEPLLLILDEVNTTMAGIIRLLLRLQKAWDDFVKVWDKTVGPLVDAVSEALDDVFGGLLSAFQSALEELLVAIKEIGLQELTSYADIWGMMNTVVAKGWPEDSFLWSDMLHYRRTSATCEALVRQAEAQKDGTDEGEERFEQFLAFALGYIVHVGTDTIAHSFVNEQCGGPYRDHPTRHHLIENHIDAWNYVQAGPGGTIVEDDWGKTPDYPDLSMSALWFHVQLTPEEPGGKQRPSPLSDDPDERKAQLDVDGEMPMWLAEGIVAALIETFEDHPHPKIYQGDAFQQNIDATLLGDVVKDVTGSDLTGPFQEVLDGIAPPPPFAVPEGFPLPWEVATAYRFMITVYKLNFNGSWELQKPRKPDFIILPPASDFTNLVTPPDFSGVGSGDLLEDACGIFVALVEWAVKELTDAITLVGDLIKMLASPGSYLFRLGLYKLAMVVWDVAMKTHEVMAHTGILMPHSEQRYDDGELRLPNEIDLPLITLGGTVDGAFQQALGDAIDPMGNLDTDLGVVVSHSVRDAHYPYYSVLQYHADGSKPDPWEFHRPWAYPAISELETDGVNAHVPTPTETYLPSAADPNAPAGAFRPMRPGPYPEGTTPDQVFFRTDAGVDTDARRRYEDATTPWQTDLLNEEFIGKARARVSPLGDPVPFSGYLIGRLVNKTGYETQFNLDSDRAYAYLTWDWIRGKEIGKTDLGFAYNKPVAAPAGAPEWDGGAAPMQLHYVDAPQPVVIYRPRDPDAPGDPAEPPRNGRDAPEGRDV